jgi:hypothetical protein
MASLGPGTGQGRHVSHLWVGDHAGRVEENGIFRLNEGGVFQLGFACEAADFQIPGFILDIGEAGYAVDVDQITGPGYSELHHGNETPSAAQNLDCLLGEKYRL